ncbi:Retrovirus-related Pol polyprotein from transposon 17.6 [Dictyocoela roeselum]|nr:Retrovirus-related Pol polyprotein from transposon 17.6 [Dictyocoela roeselum]
MINYDRIFIKNLSADLKSLYVLTGKDIKFKWTDKETMIFDDVKAKWREKLELLIPDPNGKFTLETDASNIGLGAVLRQDGCPVAYVSRVLTKSEQSYGITEKEVLASLLAMEKLQFFLIGTEFTLITDHKASEYMNFKIDFGSTRIQRWFHRFSRFNFNVVYIKGGEMVTPDALGRAFSLKRMILMIMIKKYSHFI